MNYLTACQKDCAYYYQSLETEIKKKTTCGQPQGKRQINGEFKKYFGTTDIKHNSSGPRQGCKKSVKREMCSEKYLHQKIATILVFWCRPKPLSIPTSQEDATGAW